MKFLWETKEDLVIFPSVEEDINTDVLIIGGGMTGVLCARQLEKLGVNYVLLEAKRIGRGITKGTTAVITAQHDILYQDIISKFGIEKAKQYLYANLSAVEQFKEMAKDIECDFKILPSIIYSKTDKQKMEDEVKALDELGFFAEFSTSVNLPFEVAGAVIYPEMAQFHPIKFLNSISKTLNIYENSMVTKLDGNTAYVNGFKVTAKKVIVATHFPIINKYGMYFAKQYQQRSYVIAYKNAKNLGCTIEDIEENGFYMRNYQDLLLIGGGDHRTGQNGEGYKAVEKFAKQYFPKAEEVCRWSNQDCVTLDGIPYIGEYSTISKDVFVATGYNLWGMTTSMVASDILCDMIQGKSNKYADVFATNRSMLNKQLLVNMSTTMVDFFTPTKKRCTHMGCALKWNAYEHTWDCPCHGSRFSEKGEVIDNPALKDL